MKRNLFLLALTILALSTAACSFVVRTEVPMAEPDSADWKSTGSRYSYRTIFNESYKYQYGDISVSLSLPHKRGRPISFGPPCLPVIPNFIPAKKSQADDKFTLEVALESKADPVSIDLSQVWVQFPDNKLLQPSSVQIFLGRESHKEIQEWRVEVANGRRVYDLIFDIVENDVAEFVVEMGDILINERNLKLPPLRIRKKTNYYYVPIVIGS